MKQSRCCVFDFVAVTRWRLPLTGCFLALLALLCSPVAAQTMGSSLIDAGLLPADSEDAYGRPFSVFFSAAASDPAQDIPAAVPADVTTNDRCAFVAGGCMAGSLGEITKQDGNVAVVDWVLVQLRLVPQGASAPDDTCRGETACRDQVTVVTKAALLLSDGSVSSADADDLAEGVLTFDDVDFDPATHDMYIAVNHRNHLPILSGKADTDAAPADGDYVYDFTDSGGEGIRGGVVRRGALVVATGDANASGNLTDDDLFVVDAAINAGRGGYRAEDTDLTGNLNDDDLLSVSDNINRGVARGAEF